MLSQILLAYISIPRHEGLEVIKEMAEKDAKVLYKAGEKRLGTDEKTFMQIFSERSAAQLNAISSYYHDMYGHSLKKVVLSFKCIIFPRNGFKILFCCLINHIVHMDQAIKNETSGNFCFALLTIIQCAQNPAKYFAKVFPCSKEWYLYSITYTPHYSQFVKCDLCLDGVLLES